MSLKYPDARGGFLKFHPPPAINTALFWSKRHLYQYESSANHPPAGMNQLIKRESQFDHLT